MKRYGVRLSVPVVDRCSSVLRVYCCGPGVQEISINSGGRRAAQQHGTAAGECGQCHVVSVHRKPNTDLLSSV